MTLNFKITNEDYIQFNEYHINNSPHYKKMFFCYRMMIPVLSLVLLLIIQPADVSYIVVMSLISICWVIIFPKIIKKSVFKDINKLLKEGKHNSFLGDKQLILLDNTIKMIGEGNTSECPYSNIERIVFEDKTTYLYLGALEAIIIPNTAFSSQNKKDEFFAMIECKTNHPKL